MLPVPRFFAGPARSADCLADTKQSSSSELLQVFVSEAQSHRAVPGLTCRKQISGHYLAVEQVMQHSIYKAMSGSKGFEAQMS